MPYLSVTLRLKFNKELTGNMGENLVIVESPAKAKTIQKFLGKGFTVKSSYGHIRDLSKTGLGIDIPGGFVPKYVIPAEKKKLVADLTDSARKADMVWLASDEDREGEAIAWHLYEVLGLSPEKTHRIAFHEITKTAILNAVDNPRDIDMDLVMAQQARRVLDRLVGFELSPVLWKKIQPKLSAGRVQSAALKLIVDREREISSFIGEPYFRVEGTFTVQGSHSRFKAVLDKKFDTEEEARAFLEQCRNAEFRISSVDKREGRRTPAPPFTTSSLQQEAARRLGYSLSQTMSTAQKLYEAGLITYMRTDSTNLSSLAVNTIKDTVVNLYGDRYSKVRAYQTKVKGAQEAHEAIRPTYASNIEIEGTSTEKRLYSLIWKRAIACQMADAVVEKTTVTISANGVDGNFIAEGEVVLFDGFLKVYGDGKDDENKEKGTLPALSEGDSLNFPLLVAVQKFSQRPSRYSEGSIVKKLEELGIGRPSTWATTVTTLKNHGYVIVGDKEGTERQYCELQLKDGIISRAIKTEITGAEKKKLFPENIGIVVTDYLVPNFPDILDYNFTAKVEKDLDEIAGGNMVWDKVITDFYKIFHTKVEDSLQDRTRTGAERVVGTDPATGKPVIARIGRFGSLVQLGSNDDPEKKFVSMNKGQLIESITLEEALHLLKLPRNLGTYKGCEMTVAIGKFGPYVKYDGKYVSLGKDLDPYTITREEAISLIEDHNSSESKKVIAEFGGSGIQVLNGRYGPYIKQGASNYKIPAKVNPSTLTEEDCKQIIAASPAPKRKKK